MAFATRVLCLCMLIQLSIVYCQRDLGCNVDVLIVLDGSSSVEGDFQIMRDFVQLIAKHLNIKKGGHRVAFLEYSSKTREVKWPRKEFGEIHKVMAFNEHLHAKRSKINLLQTSKEFHDFIEKLPYLQGLTYTGRAIEIVEEMLKKARRDAVKVVLFITDGFATDYHVVEEKAPLLINNRAGPPDNIFIFCAAVPTRFSVGGMANITGSLERVVYPPGVGKKIVQIMEPVLAGKDNSCLRDTVIPTSTRKTTTVPTTTEKQPTGCEVDLLFVFDFSTSGEMIHNRYVEEAIKILEGMTVSPDHTRVSMIKYSSKHRHEIVFHFKKHNNVDGVIHDMRSAYYNRGTTWTGMALRLAMTEFDRKYGARLEEATHQVVVLYTDGYSQEDPKEAAEQLRAMSGLEVYVVALSQSDLHPDEQQLQDIAGDTRRVFVDKNDDLARKLASYNRNCKS